MVPERKLAYVLAWSSADGYALFAECMGRWYSEERHLDEYQDAQETHEIYLTEQQMEAIFAFAKTLGEQHG